MFKGGSHWRPPPLNPYTQGMPEELVDPGDLDIIPEEQIPDNFDSTKKGKLTDRYCLNNLVIFRRFLDFSTIQKGKKIII